jgi:hypothetical protein
MKVVIACEYSGRTREAFRRRGHDVTSVDLLPSEDNSSHHIIGDAFEVIDRIKPELVIAHPTCTRLCNSGVRWIDNPIQDKPPEDASKIEQALWPTLSVEHRKIIMWRLMCEGAEFFAKFLRLPTPKLAIENPVMHRYARTQIRINSGYELHTAFVQPWWYGDPAFKATGFTTRGLPNLVKPATALVPPKPGTEEHRVWTARVHNLPKTPDRWKIRSRTFPGIAEAMASTWG